MKEYSLRIKYTDAYGLISLYNEQNTKALKFTLEEARARAGELLETRDDIVYVKIYKGREYIETIDSFLGRF